MARTLRKSQTRCELLLWQELRNRKLGVKFRRQAPFVFGNYKYVADFYCREKKLIIEIDGKVHEEKANKDYDEFREEIFVEAGFKVIRFKNTEVENNIFAVVDKIHSVLTPARPSPRHKMDKF